MKLTHAERRLFDLVKQHGRKPSSFYLELMEMGYSGFHKLKWQLKNKGYLIIKRKLWIDVNPEVAIENEFHKKDSDRLE